MPHEIPHQMGLNEYIEAFQRWASRFVTVRYNQCTGKCVPEMLQELIWELLKARQHSFREILLMKFRGLNLKADSRAILLLLT